MQKIQVKPRLKITLTKPFCILYNNTVDAKSKGKDLIMNKKEVLEIKKFFKPDAGIISRICSCYVDGEKDILFTSNDAYYNISSEESFKYMDIFKHTMSGSIGKNLFNLTFPLSETMPKKQEHLYSILTGKLEDEEKLKEFYQDIIDNYSYASNYYIILIYGRYDVPGKAKDGEEIFDASTDVYDFILCSICPVNLTKAALGYDAKENAMRELIRDWVVEPPVKGFLYPAFNDRATDIHSLLYFSKDAVNIDEAFIQGVFDIEKTPTDAKTQNTTFNEIISDTLGNSGSLDMIKQIQDNFNEMVENAKINEEPLFMTRSTISKIFERSGDDDETLESLNEVFTQKTAEADDVIMASNITSMKSLTIESPDLTIKVKPEHNNLVTTKVIDGRKYFLIPVSEDVTVNGISIKE